jgi:tripartite-type tricarboxylate transporter receptor subunit TctC
VTTGSIAINPNLLAKVSRDPVRDFTPISMLAASTHVVAVHPSLPAKTIDEY